MRGLFAVDASCGRFPEWHGRPMAEPRAFRRGVRGALGLVLIVLGAAHADKIRENDLSRFEELATGSPMADNLPKPKCVSQ